MNYCSRTRHESKLYPGVFYTINRMNERRRVQRELAIAELRTAVNEKQAALQKALAERDSLEPGVLDKLNAEFGELLHGKWYPAWIRWGAFSIEGLEIDGEKATISTLCEAGPSDLVQEVFEAVLDASGLNTVAEKNSESLGISGGQADGKTSDSIATGATQPENGGRETAPSSIQGT